MDFMTYLTLVSILALLDRKKIYKYKLVSYLLMYIIALTFFPTLLLKFFTSVASSVNQITLAYTFYIHITKPPKVP